MHSKKQEDALMEEFLANIFLANFMGGVRLFYIVCSVNINSKEDNAVSIVL